jgi:chlorobactene glucosyltransferase
MIIALITACIQIVLALQAIRNRKLFPRLKKPKYVHPYNVAVCLPMRNEALNAERILNSIIKEIHLINEVIILDDESTDATPTILAKFASQYHEKIRVLHGTPKPDNWRGKVWAMSQLAEAARSEYLLFLDADVSLDDGIASLLDMMKTEKVDYLSVFPRQVTTASTDLLVNHIYTTLLHLLPMQFVKDAKYPSAVAGCGQVQLLTKTALEKAGGYYAIKESLHDGLHLARKVKMNGGKVSFAYGADSISCRMYRSFAEAWSGFTRNAYQATGSLISLVVTSSIIVFGFIIGPLVSIGSLLPTVIVVVSTSLLYSNYYRIIRSFDFSPGFIVRLPLSIVLFTLLQWVSYIRHKLGIKSIWRGRSV